MGKFLIKTCKNRIKPTMLRDVKTEALLVFIRTTLEQFFDETNKRATIKQIGSKEDSEILLETLQVLLLELQDCVVNSSYLRSVISTSQLNKSMRMIAKKEEPLMVYYDAIVKQIEVSLAQGQIWIPEQLVICLLSQWIEEEKKSITLYPFLQNIDYLSLLERYDKARIQAKQENDFDKISVTMNMYSVGISLIDKLNKTTYKMNTKRVSKSRNKKNKS